MSCDRKHECLGCAHPSAKQQYYAIIHPRRLLICCAFVLILAAAADYLIAVIGIANRSKRETQVQTISESKQFAFCTVKWLAGSSIRVWSPPSVIFSATAAGAQVRYEVDLARKTPLGAERLWVRAKARATATQNREFFSYEEISGGFPYGSWSYVSMTTRTGETIMNGVPFVWLRNAEGKHECVLPLYFHVNAWCANAIFYGTTISMLLLIIVWIRRTLRCIRQASSRRTGSCIQCGYSIKDQICRRCPECGNQADTLAAADSTDHMS